MPPARRTQPIHGQRCEILKKKLIHYVFVLLVFIGLGATYFGIQFSTIRSAMQESATQRRADAAEDVSMGLESMVNALEKDVLMAVTASDTSDLTFEEMLGAMDSIERRYVAVDAEGRLKNTPDVTLGLATVEAVGKQGFALSHLGTRERELWVALVVPGKDSTVPYVALLESFDVFYDELFQAQCSDPEHEHVLSMLYDEWGQPLVTNAANKQSAYKQVLERDVLLLTEENASTVYQDTYLDYHGFAFLPQPSGWAAGFQFHMKEYEALYTLLLIGVVAYVVICLVTFAIASFIAVAAERKARESARNFRDPLTSLISAMGLEGSATEFLRKHPIKEYSLVSVDVIGFQRFNTIFGNENGDRLLKVIGAVIDKKYHCATRIGSDTFMFLAKNLYPVAPTYTKELKDAIARHLGKDYAEMVEFKFGVFPILQNEFHFRKAYDGSLLALKSAKQQPKASEVVYDRYMQREEEMRRSIEGNMMFALAREEFVIYIQPKFWAKDLSCSGGEVLVRWDSSKLGFLSPGQFIPLFEQNGFIIDLDFYMVDKAFALLQGLMDGGAKLVDISVNLSRVTIAVPNFLSRLAQIAQKYTVPRKYIEIEITESALVEAGKKMVELTNALKEMGFSISMDDFGTGYSSLNALRELPVDTLKIDKSLLPESDDAGKGRQIVQSILDMANAIELSTVSEGVETNAQLEFMRAAGCEIIQGFLLGRPMTAQDFVQKYCVEE